MVYLRNMRPLLVRASVVPSSPILVTLMNGAQSSSETSVLTTATRRNIPENTILHSNRCENFKSYIRVLRYFTLFVLSHLYFGVIRRGLHKIMRL
jgi:hypothetical protein